jgi:MoaA/NifB/PqqE/SkfB family radical SAM enzyme
MRWRYLARAPLAAARMLARGRYDFNFDLAPMSVRMTPRRAANALRTGLNLAYRKNVPWGWPIHMQFELTNFCNLHCPICPTGAGLLDRKAQAMDVDLFANCMNEVGPYLLTAMLWVWGEPLLHPRFADFVRIARDHRVLPVFSTNGQNLNDDAVQEGLLREPPEYVIVAIDGLTDETNSRYRVGAKLEPILAGVHRQVEARRRLNQRRPLLHMRYMTMRHNQHEMPNVKEFAQRHGFDMLSLRTLSIIDDDESRHRELLPDAEPYRAYQYDRDRRKARGDFVCQLPFSFPSMLADGTIVACEQDCRGTLPLGRYGPGRSFASVWYGAEAARIRKMIRDNRAAVKFCQTCPYADRSANTCSVESFQLTDAAGSTERHIIAN